MNPKKIMKIGKGDIPIEGKMVLIKYTGKYNDKIFEQAQEN